MRDQILDACTQLRDAYEQGLLGNMRMPEDTHPEFSSAEQRLAYFTLPMSLNYQRNSYTLWESALQTYEDEQTRDVFEVSACAEMSEQQLREHLLTYKLALQPNKHINTWQRICSTIAEQWGSIHGLLEAAEHNFLKLRELVQKKHKKGFPYLSGPKIFNYWSWIIQEYTEVELENSEYIEIAPDTHIIKCSVKLGVISQQESESLSRDDISAKWRNLLEGSEITPIHMHAPLWFWSRNDFKYQLHE